MTRTILLLIGALSGIAPALAVEPVRIGVTTILSGVYADLATPLRAYS